MTIKYQWAVTAMSTSSYPTSGYVTVANYTVTGTDNSTPPVVAEFSSQVQFSIDPNQVSYIPYNELTEEIVLGWIQSEPNLVVNTQACLDGMINSIINPPVSPTNIPLPWVK